MNRALTYLLWRSFLGSLRAKASKLKQGQYWIGLLGVVIYFGFLVLPALLSEGKDFLSIRWSGTLLGLMMSLSFTLSWLFQVRRNGLGFTESEIELLFSAPLSKHELLHYKLLKAQVGLAFTSVFFLLFSASRLSLSNVFFTWLGLFCILNLIHIHGLLSVLVCQKWKERWFIWPLRLLCAAASSLPLIMGYMALLRTDRGTLDLAQSIQLFERGQVDGWLLKAWMSIARLPFTSSVLEFVLPLIVVLMFWIVCYAMIVYIGIHFESELYVAQERLKMLRAVRAGHLFVRVEKPIKKAWFRLRPKGALWRAIAWKNFTSAMRHIPWVPLGIFLTSVSCFVLIPMLMTGKSNWMLYIASLASVLAMMTSMFGSQMIRDDLRSSLRGIDLLKSLPMSASELIRGEIYGAAAVVLTMNAILLSIVGLCFCWSASTFRVASLSLLGVLSFGAVLTGFVLCSFWLENALAVFFPSWVVFRSEAQEYSSRMEHFGRNVISMFVKFVGLFFLSFLPAFFAGLCFVLFSVYSHPLLLALGAFLFLGVMWLEVEMGIEWLAPHLDALDPSLEDLG